VTGPRSLRSRVVLGSLLWTLGLLPLTHVVAILLMRNLPWMHPEKLAHAGALLFLALGFMLAGLFQLRRSLTPFDRLRASLSAVREGSAERLEGTFPTEVQPLVNDLNDLLVRREQMVRSALQKAGDLAHGLKTPLAVLAQEAERIEGEGRGDLAATLSQQVERMRRRVEYHLAHARAAAGTSASARCSVAESADGLRRTLLRIYAGRGIEIELHVPAEHVVRGRREDLDEVLGNLLDNACKWARSRVRVRSVADGAEIVIDVEDDGAGIAEAMREVVMQRGVRADEVAPGSGLGLAISRELAELYGGSIALDRAELGGLRARVRLSRQDPPAGR
jgi:signal transduction histidine kinase